MGQRAWHIRFPKSKFRIHYSRDTYRDEEVSDFRNTLDKLIKVDVYFDINTMKSRVKNNVLRVDEKSFSNTILEVNPHWDYTRNIESIRQKYTNETTIDKLQLKHFWIIGSVFNGVGEPILSSFALDNCNGFEVFLWATSIVLQKIS